ncbi:MAG: hypothetical protein AB2693_31825, partial [Candidatus Thiodiazotropha sp.]
MSTDDLSTFSTALPYSLINEKLLDFIEWTFQREGSPFLTCSERNAVFTSEHRNQYKLWSRQNIYDVLTYLLDNIH